MKKISRRSILIAKVNIMEKVYRPKGTKHPNIKIFLLPSVMKREGGGKDSKVQKLIVGFRLLNGNNELEAHAWTIIIKFGEKINSLMIF